MPPEDLTPKLRTWLRTEGYPFELQVGRALREADWSVYHGRHYTDGETSKPREIDVHAAWGPYVGHGKIQGEISVHLIGECKTSQKPWVVFTTKNPDEFPHRMPGQLAPNPLSARAIAHCAITRPRSLSVLLPGMRIGHGATKAFIESRGTDPSGPYAAVSSAVAAASALTREHYSMIGKMSWVGIYIPIVFFGGPLFEFYLDDNGNEVLEPIERVHVVTSGVNLTRERLLVQIVSGGLIQAFATSDVRQFRSS